MTLLLIYCMIAFVMEKILEKTLLYDFYGELLTEHQQAVYQDVVFNDYSLSEVAEAYQISRQGVYDLIRRCSQQLEGYEAKLHLVQKFVETKQMVNRINELTQEFLQSGNAACVQEIDAISNDILKNF